MVWFAAGAATTGLAAVLATVLLPKDAEDSARPYLLLQHALPPDGPSDNETEWIASATAGAKLLYDCGARQIHNVPPAPDVNGYVLLPLTKANSDVSECAIKQGAKEGFEMRVIVTTDIFETRQK